MPLEVDRAAIRKLDMGSFTGDAWADDATLAVPDAAVPRLSVDGGPVRWTVYGMSSNADDATQEVDTTASISTCLVKIMRTPAQQPLVTLLAASSGTIVAHEVTESDVAVKDVFAIAVPAATAGTAPWLWIVPTSGCSVLASGVSP
jgi:hypothetical protein